MVIGLFSFKFLFLMVLRSIIFGLDDLILVVFFKNFAMINEGRKMMNLLHSDCFFDFGSQSIHELNTPWTIINSIVVTRAIT